MKTVLALLMVAFLAACVRAPVPAPENLGHDSSDAPGSGAHKIVGISILAKDSKDLDKGKNPTTLKVGRHLALQVWAAWAIPYAEDVTGRVKLTVRDPELGALDDHAVFTALKPGKVVIQSALAANAIAGDESGGGFTDRMELTIVE